MAGADRHTAAWPVIRALPPALMCTRSDSTTVSVPGGVGSPVSTHVKSAGASRHPRTTGVPVMIAGDGRLGPHSNAVHRRAVERR